MTPARNPVTDFTRMANDVTRDLEIIHQTHRAPDGGRPLGSPSGRNNRYSETKAQVIGVESNGVRLSHSHVS